MIAFFAGDVAGGASSQDQVPVLHKEPHVWLRVCQNRALALQKKHAEEERAHEQTIQYSEAG